MMLCRRQLRSWAVQGVGWGLKPEWKGGQQLFSSQVP